LAYCNSDLFYANFLWNFLASLFTVFKTKLECLFNISQAFIIGLALGMRFGNQRAASYIESVRCLPNDDSVFHTYLYECIL
jgi:hypothetical protein